MKYTTTRGNCLEVSFKIDVLLIFVKTKGNFTMKKDSITSIFLDAFGNFSEQLSFQNTSYRLFLYYPIRNIYSKPTLKIHKQKAWVCYNIAAVPSLLTLGIYLGALDTDKTCPSEEIKSLQQSIKQDHDWRSSRQ